MALSKEKSVRVATCLLLVITAIGLFSPLETLAAQTKQNDLCTMPFQDVAPPLTELENQRYQRMDGSPTEYEGGLYANGSNSPPPEHAAAGLQIARTVVPLDSQGQVDFDNGKIVMVSIGMSNTAQEFAVFERSLRDNPAINPAVKTINGAVGGRTAENWVDSESDAWDELSRRLQHANVPSEQVQIAWIKLTMVRGGEFPEKARLLQQHLAKIVQQLKSRFPNLKITYLSSRTRSYTYWRGLSPEPVAYETGFAVKWLIDDQIAGDPNLNFDPANGPVRAPFLIWGPYLWANGEIPRQDGFVWLAEDLARDCTHPSETGKQKVARLMLDFFLSDPTSRLWFTDSGSESSDPTPPATEQEGTATGYPPAPSALPSTASRSPEPASAIKPTAVPPPARVEYSFGQGILTGIAASGVFVALILLVKRWGEHR